MSSIFNSLKQALVKTSNKISSGIDNIFLKKKLDNETLEELEELLISSDISSSVAATIINNFKSIKFDKGVSTEIIKASLANLISDQLTKAATPFKLRENDLTVILICGVNGNGKTTTIGKLASLYSNMGFKIAIAACDTFRAAAINQLEQWANKAGALMFKGEEGSDPGSVAYKAALESKEKDIDILFIDTAGRLHNYKNLMDELAKIVRVIKKIDELAPHQNVLVIDATTGQNAYNQVEHFNKSVELTSLIITKLDGTAKAGVIVGIVEKFSLPIHFIGIGEKIEDLKEFDAKAFAKALVG